MDQVAVPQQVLQGVVNDRCLSAGARVGDCRHIRSDPARKAAVLLQHMQHRGLKRTMLTCLVESHGVQAQLELLEQLAHGLLALLELGAVLGRVLSGALLCAGLLALLGRRRCPWLCTSGCPSSSCTTPRISRMLQGCAYRAFR